MQKKVTELRIGAKTPFTILHITDTHLALADGRDCERKRELAAERGKKFSSASMFLSESAIWAKKNGALLVHTGDLIDFVSCANLELAEKFTDENDCFFTAGNHEFSLYVGEAFEDEEYRNQSLDRVQAAFKNDIRFSSRTVYGINLVSIDDSYYRFERVQLEALKREVGRGLPIVLFMHTPLYTPELFEYIMGTLGEGNAALTAVPPKLLGGYTEYRLRQQKPDEITLEACEYIKSQPLIKAVFAGHLHYDFETKLTDTLTQYVTGGNYCGAAREIRIL